MRSLLLAAVLSSSFMGSARTQYPTVETPSRAQLSRQFFRVISTDDTEVTAQPITPAIFSFRRLTGPAPQKGLIDCTWGNIPRDGHTFIQLTCENGAVLEMNGVDLGRRR